MVEINIELMRPSASELNKPPFLFFIGNSGAGKDTAIDMIETMLADQDIKVTNIKRYITRPAHPSEDYHSVRVDEFKRMADADVFAFYWEVYDTYYGYLQRDIDIVRYRDVITLFNISRSLIPVVSKKYPWCTFVAIQAPLEVSKERVKQREREDKEQKEKRIRRMTKSFTYADDTIFINNDGTLDDLREKLQLVVEKILPTIA